MFKGSEDSFLTACSTTAELNSCGCLKCSEPESILYCCQHFTKLRQNGTGNVPSDKIIISIYKLKDDNVRTISPGL